MLSNYNNKVESGKDSNRERGRKGDRQAEKRRERDSKRKLEKQLPVAKREAAAAAAEIEQAYNKSCS